MIMAAKARNMADRINEQDAWALLEKKIKEKALLGEYSCEYDEENEGAKFNEAPKEVRRILEAAGYVVKYNRCSDVWAWGYAPTYHGRYTIGWK